MKRTAPSFTLAGFVRVIDATPAFVLPVFEVETGLAVQEIDDHDAIVGFQSADVGELPVVKAPNQIEKAVGAVCLVAYELSDGKILYGTPDELRAQLNDAIRDPVLYDKSFTKWEIANYCGRHDILDEINNQITCS